MPGYKVFKETALPAQLEPSSIYFVTSGVNANYLEIYVSDMTGSAARRVLRQQDVESMITAAVAGAGASNTFFADDIAARNALTPKTNAMVVHVVDASGDPTVTNGGATYMYRSSNSTWVKISEFESLDLTLSWANIQGRPQRTASQIEAAVDATHSHANKTQLDKIGQDADGNLTYGGNLPTTGWSSVNW